MNNLTICVALIAAGCTFSLNGCDSRDNTPTTRASQPAASQNTSSVEQDTSGYSADNTGRNWDDRGRDAKTPIDQSQSSEHIKLTSDIRQAVMANDMLSMGAKNCKIITDDSGMVWLRGVVNSHDERNQIQRLARQIAGTNNVKNELEVKDAS